MARVYSLTPEELQRFLDVARGDRFEALYRKSWIARSTMGCVK